MRVNMGREKGWRHFIGAVLLIFTAPTISACAAPTQYMGIPLEPTAGIAPPPLSSTPDDDSETVGFKVMEYLPVISGLRDAGCPIDQSTESFTEACKQEHQRLVLEAYTQKLDSAAVQFASGDLSDTPLSTLAAQAQSGDKHAQLELGKRFESGRGVERDLGKAQKLYRLAASDSGGTIWIYSPAVGNGTKGRVIPVNSGPKRVGLAEAKRLLAKLERVE